MAPKSLDWESIRKDYEDEGLNPAALGEKYNCSATTVYQYARANGWKRPILDDDDIEIDIDEELESITIENAIHNQKRMLARLMAELDASTSKLGQMKRWIDEGTRGNSESRRRAMYQAVSMGSRAVMLKNAAAALKTLCEIEGMSGIKPRGKKAQAAAAVDAIDDDRFSQWDTPKAA